ncbi:hypothetical protein LPLAFNJD_LOCUS3723 [Methylorubrum aminovorans]
MARRIAEGHSKLEAIRRSKRYIARQVSTLVTGRQKAISQTCIAAWHIEESSPPGIAMKDAASRYGIGTPSAA